MPRRRDTTPTMIRFALAALLMSAVLSGSGCSEQGRDQVISVVSSADSELPKLRTLLDGAERSLVEWAESEDTATAAEGLSDAKQALDVVVTSLSGLSSRYVRATKVLGPGSARSRAAEAAAAYSSYSDSTVNLRDSLVEAKGFTLVLGAANDARRYSSILLDGRVSAASQKKLRRTAAASMKSAVATMEAELAHIDPNTSRSYKRALQTCSRLTSTEKPEVKAAIACYGESGRIAADSRDRMKNVMARMRIASAKMSSATERLEKLRLDAETKR